MLDRIFQSARAQLVALAALVDLRSVGLTAAGVGKVTLGKTVGDSVRTGKGVEGRRRGPEEVALGIAAIGAVLQGSDLGNKGRQGVAGEGSPLVGEPDRAGGLLDSQLGALLVAEEFIGFPALAAEGRDGGGMGPRDRKSVV